MPATAYRQVLVVLMAVVGLAFAATPALAADSPASLLASSLKAAGKEQSVHYVVVSRFPGSSVKQVSDVGALAGIQRITFTAGGKTGHCTVIVLVLGAFVRGDAFTLHGYIGMPAALAAKDANVWLYVAKTSAAYPSLAAAVTLPSFLQEIDLSKPLSRVATRTVSGQQVVGVRGRESAPFSGKLLATLYSSTSGKRLPVEEVVKQGKTQVTVTLSNWNETLRIPVPSEGSPKSPTRPAPPGVVA
jgi:hypothetical protein